MGLYWIMEDKMEAIIVHRGYVGIMATTIVYLGPTSPSTEKFAFDPLS